MFCEKCGKNNLEEASFCAYCGTAMPEKQQIESPTPTSITHSDLKKKKMPRWNKKTFGLTVVGTIVLSTIVILCVLWFADSKKTINLKKYIYKDVISMYSLDTDAYIETVHGLSYYGFNHQATISTDATGLINWEQLMKDCLGKEYKKNENDAIMFMNAFKCKIDKTDNLTNGDEVHLSIQWDEKIMDAHNIKIHGENNQFIYTYKVKDLKDVTILNPLSMVNIVPTGINPSGHIKIQPIKKQEKVNQFTLKYKGFVEDDNIDDNDTDDYYETAAILFDLYYVNKKIETIRFEWNEKYDGKCDNGSTITFHLSAAHTDENQKKYAFEYSPTQKSHKVCELSEYYNKNTNLSTKQIEQIKNRAESIFVNRYPKSQLGEFVRIEVIKSPVGEWDKYYVFAMYKNKNSNPDTKYWEFNISKMLIDKNKNIKLYPESVAIIESESLRLYNELYAVYQ